MVVDKFGALGQVQSDGSIEGGDSACWTGHYIYLTDYDFEFSKFFEVSPGAYVRHPHPDCTNNGFGAYYKNPWAGCMSRDQLTGVVAALIKRGDRLAMLRFVLHHALRGFLFAYNTIPNGQDPDEAHWKMPDLTLFDFWACELRGFGWFSWLFWPLLCVLDIHMFFGVVIEPYSKDPDNINLMMKHFISRDYVPTPTSWLTDKLLDRGDAIVKLDIYWSGWREMPDVVEEYIAKLY